MRKDDLYFNLTCGACPEQYDVLDRTNNNTLVAYVRLRHGFLYCECPDIGGDMVYSHHFDDDWKGMFNEKEREQFLGEIAEAIVKYYNEKNSSEG